MLLTILFACLLASAPLLGPLLSRDARAQDLDLAGDEPGPVPRALLEPAPRARPQFQSIQVNNRNRAEVVQLYRSAYLASEGVPSGWNGNRSTCVAGTTSQAYLDATVLRVNFFRALAGLPGDIVLSNAWNLKCQDAALMMSKQGQLSHAPGTSWACYTPGGAEAAGLSNLYLGRDGPSAVDGYVDDSGTSSFFIGHRRWILFPPVKIMGSGSLPATGGQAANALWVIGGFGARPAQPEWVAWPPPGFVPYQAMPRVSGRWSFSYPAANFSAATVTLSRGNQKLAVTLEEQRNDIGYADNTLVWIPQGVSTSAPLADDTYSVSISNVVVGGVTRAFQYDVTIINPDQPDLTVARVPGTKQTTISWPSPATSYQLQWTTGLVTRAWANAILTPVLSGGQFRVTMTVSNQSYFFRLRKP